MFRNLLLAIAFTFSTLWAAAQVYPVSSTVTVPYPSPIFLSEYVELTSTMSVTATLNDFNQPSQNFRLKITIEGNGIVISTNPNYLPAPLTLSPNIPYVFSASDLADYFSVDNLVFSGIDVNAFVQSGGKIPEGMYQFCAEILDYNTGRAISGKGCAFANIFQEQPPRLLQPACENIVMPSTPQNILFQWQVAPGGSPALSATALYTLYLFQIIDENANGYNAVQNGQAIPVYESQPTPLTTFNLDLTATQLLPNKRYAWRVKATDQSGKDVYANEGFSAWCWFNYGYPTGGAIQLKTPVKDFRFTRTGDKILTWGTSDKGTQGQSYDYKLKIVKMEEGQNNDDAMANNQAWLEETLPNTSSTQGASYEITQTVDPEDHFAWKVVAETEGVEVASSEVWDFWGPPLILKFNAGNFTVFVKRSLNKDLNDYNCRQYH